MKKVPIREAQPGQVYFTPRGMKVEVLRLRPDGQDVVVRSITSGGHEVVLPGGLMVTGEEVPVAVVTEEPGTPTQVANTLSNLIFYIVKESQVTVDEIADITGYSKDDVELGLEELLRPAINEGAN